jgi:ribosome-binding factor A
MNRQARPNQRPLRVGEELRHALARIFERGELRDPALAGATVTVTEVRVSPDLKHATVFVMPLAGANAEDIIAALARSAPYLRHVLAREVRLRYAPGIAFALDTAFDHASRISALLHRPEVQRDLAAEDAKDDGDGA